MNTGFALAALFGLITFGVHAFVGGRYAARPLLAAEGLDKAARWLNYYTWHMATALLLFMAAGFALCAFGRASSDVALLLTLMAAAFSPLSVWTAIKGGIAPWRLPASWLFAAIAALGVFGLGQVSGAERALSLPPVAAADPLAQP